MVLLGDYFVILIVPSTLENFTLLGTKCTVGGNYSPYCAK